MSSPADSSSVRITAHSHHSCSGQLIMPCDGDIAADVAGIELAASCTMVTGDRGKALMFITAGASSALGNTAIGALAGGL